MTSAIAVMNNEFTDRFNEFVLSELNPAVRSLREIAFASFMANGFPSVRNEEWRYTNVAPAVKNEWSVKTAASEALEQSDVELLATFDTQRNGFAALNLAFAEFHVIRMPRDTA